MDNILQHVIELETVYSSDEDDMDTLEFLRLPPLLTQNYKKTFEYEMIRTVHATMKNLRRVKRVKINNYVENVVRLYIERDFIMHFRLSRKIAYELISRFETSTIYTSLQDYAGYVPISPEKHILCYLWFLGHESASYRDVADRFGITLSTLYVILTRVTNFIMSIANNIIKFPTEEERKVTETYYATKKGFPGITGAIDGTHIRIDKPKEDPDSYINRKQYFSLHVQGVANHEMKFLDVFIGYPGSVHDARVFKESSLSDSLNEMCGANHYLLGDSAYPCLKKLIVPYKDNGHLTRAQKNFNQRLSSCRVIIENTFGCLKQRFRQLYHFKLRNIVRMVQIIHAACVLHNLANVNDIKMFEPPLNEENPDVLIDNMIQEEYELPDGESGRQVRDELCRQLAMQ